MTAPGPQPGGNAFNRNVAAGGSVYTSTNQASGNSVLFYHRATDGSLTHIATYSTNGTGTGAGLGSQGAVTLSTDGTALLVVNAGSNDVTVFTRQSDGSLAFSETITSGGTTPISITESGGLVYVLNSGGDGNIAGYTLSGGTLTPIHGSRRHLSQLGGTMAPQIQFKPGGDVLVVTEKGTNLIDTYVVQPDGTTVGPTTHASAGATPFGFAFAGNRLIVSEAHGGAAAAGTVSSYRVSDAGNTAVISPAIPDFQTAPCWMVITPDGAYAYTTNTGSNSISSYSVRPDGTITLLNAAAAGADGGPIDEALSRGSTKFLYVLNAVGTIDVYEVHADGTLSTGPIGGTGLPAGTTGLAAT